MNEPVQHIKAIGQRDITLFCISAILLLDTLAAGAAGGPSILFWWLFFGLIFFIPNALMTAELGCTFPEQGGIYAWVRDAYGERWSARVTWSYWVNVAVWLPAIYILFAGVFAQMFAPGMSMGWQVAIAIGLSWITVALNIVTLEIGKWVPNLGALIKVVIFLVIIIGGGNYALHHELANEFTLASIKPRWGSSLEYLGLLIYGMLGFELISAGSEEMKNPARDVPRGILFSGLIIISAYTLATAAILAVIPAGEVNLVEGLLDTLYLLLGDSAAGRGLAMLLGVGALYTFFSNGATWALGCNRAVAEAALEGELPSVLALESKRNGTPVGAAVSIGVASTVILLLYSLLAGSNEDLFWGLFSFSAVLFLLPYLGMSLAFLKLRHKYPQRERPFRVPGGIAVARLCTAICLLVLCLAIMVFCYTPGDGIQWPVLLGSIILMLTGEVLIRRNESKPQAELPAG